MKVKDIKIGSIYKPVYRSWLAVPSSFNDKLVYLQYYGRINDIYYRYAGGTWFDLGSFLGRYKRIPDIKAKLLYTLSEIKYQEAWKTLK